jgi:hypothetical protein
MGSAPTPVEPALLGLAGLIPGSPPPEMPKSVSFNMAMHAFTSTDGTPCADLEAAENLALDFIRAKSPVMPRRADVFELQRAGSAIAQVTRRGRGNILLCHPATAYRLVEEEAVRRQHGSFVPNDWNKPPEHLYGWDEFNQTHGFHFTGTMWTHRRLPTNEIIVLYRGTSYFDGGFFAVGHATKPYFITNTFGRCPPEDYARIVQF